MLGALCAHPVVKRDNHGGGMRKFGRYAHGNYKVCCNRLAGARGLSEEDAVDRNVDDAHKEPYEAHDRKPNRCCRGNLNELCPSGSKRKPNGGVEWGQGGVVC
jgi:hypothetical protein